MGSKKGQFLLCLFFLSLCQVFSQTIIKGKIIDSESREALPFVSVFFEGTPIATYSDDQGNFLLETTTPKDSLTFSFFGYKNVKVAITPDISQVVNVTLYPAATALQAVVLTNKVDPAVKVIKNVLKNKEKYDKRNLEAYEYESFTRIMAGFDKIPERLKDKKLGKELSAVLDSMKADGYEKAALPFFASEAVSKYYYRKSPEKSTEYIEGTKVTGVFVEDGSIVSQLIGTSFQNYNFYQNWMTILEKEFISPIAEGAFGFYEFRMLDTLHYDSLPIYEIRVTPRREQDLAFEGKIWIQDSTFALQGVKVNVSKSANINYVSAISIEQELSPTIAGPWLPEFTEVYIKFSGISENWTNLETTFKCFNSDFKVNQPKLLKFYDQPVEVADDAFVKEDSFWQEKRQEPLTAKEERMYALIDTVKNLPTVRSYIEVIDVAVNGYYEAGILDIGPYLYAYAWNDTEGHRFRLGFRTNKSFSNKWILKGYGAYGTRDRLWKYSGSLGYIFDRKRWTVAEVSYKFDVDQIAIPEDKLEEKNNLFLAFTKWGSLIAPTYNTTVGVSFLRQFTKDFSQKIVLRNRIYDPAFNYAFINEQKANPVLQDVLTTSEVILESRYARDEIFVINDNQRISLGTKSWPVIKMKLTLGLKDVFGSEFGYQKLDFGISDNIKVGVLGRSYFDLSYGKIFSEVPLPLLEVHLGNQTPFYTTAGYNLMDYFEFVSDQYVSLKYRHYFQGVLFNRIPLMQKLNWRFLTTASVLYGGLSNKNKMVSAPFDKFGNQTVQFSSLKDMPYIEVGYGIENIFKILRVDAFHRLTYLDKLGVRRFGVKVSMQFSL